MDKQLIKVSDQWTMSKSKLAFVIAASEMEAHAIKLGHSDHLMSYDAAWGRYYLLLEIKEEMSAVIDADEPILSEVKEGA